MFKHAYVSMCVQNDFEQRAEVELFALYVVYVFQSVFDQRCAFSPRNSTALSEIDHRTATCLFWLVLLLLLLLFGWLFSCF